MLFMFKALERQYLSNLYNSYTEHSTWFSSSLVNISDFQVMGYSAFALGVLLHFVILLMSPL